MTVTMWLGTTSMSSRWPRAPARRYPLGKMIPSPTRSPARARPAALPRWGGGQSPGTAPRPGAGGIYLGGPPPVGTGQLGSIPACMFGRENTDVPLPGCWRPSIRLFLQLGSQLDGNSPRRLPLSHGGMAPGAGLLYLARGTCPGSITRTYEQARHSPRWGG